MESHVQTCPASPCSTGVLDLCKDALPYGRIKKRLWRQPRIHSYNAADELAGTETTTKGASGNVHPGSSLNPEDRGLSRTILHWDGYLLIHHPSR